MSLSQLPPLPAARRPAWPACLLSAIAAFMYLASSIASAAPSGDPDASAIVALIEQLGSDTAADAAMTAKLRPLIARSRVIGPDRATIAGLPEDAWLGTLETQWIDKQDSRGGIFTALAQRILISDGNALRVFTVHNELETIADGVPVILTGLRVGNRMLVTGVSHPPSDGPTK